MKKLLSLVLSAVMLLSCFCVYASAYDSYYEEEIIAEDIASAIKSSSLIISGTTATCKSSYDDTDSSIYSVKAVQTLEKHWALGLFFKYNNAEWEKTVYTDSLSMTNTESGLVSGTYRLKTTFTVTFTNGSTETIDVYSGEKTIS